MPALLPSAAARAIVLLPVVAWAACLLPIMVRPAAAAQNCIATYDRKGTVTGRYCTEGPPEGPGETIVEAPPPGQPGGKRSAARRVAPAFPEGVDIHCGGKGKRCRGTFFLR